MKLAVLFPTTKGMGGMETMTKTLAKGCAQAGIGIHVFGLGASTVDSRWREGLPFTELECGTHNKLLQLGRYAAALAGHLKTYAPDALITLYPSSIIVARLAMLLSGRRIPVLSWMHFPVRPGNFSWALRSADCHLAISSGIARSLKQRFHLEDRRVHLVYNSVTLPQSLRNRDPAERTVRFLYVGRVQETAQKRTRDLIQAAGGLHGDFELAIVGDVVGDGRDRENLATLARELGVADQVRWVGWQASPWTAVENVDVVVLSSAFEGFPMVLVEAMSRGIPCISSNCETGPDDIVVPDGNGWLYPPGDVEALRALMQRIIDDRSILPEPAAVAASVQKFSIEAMMGRFNSALKSVAG